MISRTEGERSRTWASRRAFASGLPEAIPGITVASALILYKAPAGRVFAETVHSLPLLHDAPLDYAVLGVLAGLALLTVRGFKNMSKSIDISVGPDSARDYYQQASKWRRRSLGLANVFVPVDLWKAKYPTE